jgi:phage antirepressor YoqD-like protein
MNNSVLTKLEEKEIVARAFEIITRDRDDLKKQVEELKPKAAFYDAVANSDDWMEMSAAVKLLAIKGWGRNKTFQLLRKKGVLRGNNEPYQDYVDQGCFKIIEQKYDNPKTLEIMINRKPVISQKGVDFIRKIIESELILTEKKEGNHGIQTYSNVNTQ